MDGNTRRSGTGGGEERGPRRNEGESGRGTRSGGGDAAIGSVAGRRRAAARDDRETAEDRRGRGGPVRGERVFVLARRGRGGPRGPPPPRRGGGAGASARGRGGGGGGRGPTARRSRRHAPSGLASTSFLLTARTPSMIPSTVGACCAATAWISTSVVCRASASDESAACPRLSFVTKSSSATWMLACPWRPIVRREPGWPTRARASAGAAEGGGGSRGDEEPRGGGPAIARESASGSVRQSSIAALQHPL